jgi:hypothetical protein
VCATPFAMTTAYFKRPRIVRVDDDPGRVEYLKNQLFGAEFQTVTMATGGLDAILGNEPCLVLSLPAYRPRRDHVSRHPRAGDGASRQARQRPAPVRQAAGLPAKSRGSRGFGEDDPLVALVE